MANLSQQKRERMLAFLDRIREEHKMDEKTLIAINEIENELTRKKYGLVWEEHTENVDIQMETKVPVFTEDKDMEIFATSEKPYNFLLEGDNLHSLKLLEKTHAGRVDVIYIDPPYNIGGDFIYNDNYVAKEDAYKHSKWLSFMSHRLGIAKRLLSSKGTIFISIDDNEQAPLKLLCDEIFGEECFVADIAWQRAYSPRNDSKGISQEKEHILSYSRYANWSPKKLPRTDKMNSKYKNPDGDSQLWRTSDAFAPSAATHQGMVYAIQHPFTGEMIYPYNGACWPLRQSDMLAAMREWGDYELRDLKDEHKRAGVCGVSVESVRKGVMGIVLVTPVEEAKKHAEEIMAKGPWPKFFFTKKGKGGIARKTYLIDTNGRVVTNLWPFSEVGHTDEAKKEIKAIFSNQKVFDTPKPTRLLKRIIQIAADDDSIILDFFAGSGTTAQAVLELNKEDGGNRRFILCTNNENGICENVTYPRVKTVVTGIRPDGSEYSDGIPSNLKYYRTDFVPKSAYEMQDGLLDHIREMVQLEHGIDLDDKQYVIIMDDDAADELEENWSDYPELKGIYMSSDVLLTGTQQALFDGAGLNIIPEYYFEAELREAGQAL